MGREVDADLALADVAASDYDAIVLPGGRINPDKLRTVDAAVRRVRDFASGNKVVATICHGPWMLVEADVVRGREVTSIRTDLVNAGAPTG